MRNLRSHPVRADTPCREPKQMLRDESDQARSLPRHYRLRANLLIIACLAASIAFWGMVMGALL